MAGSRRNLTTSYAPRSPDLSALSASQQPSYAHDQHTRSIPPHSQPYDQGSLSHQHRDAFPVPHSAPSSAYLAPPLLDDSFGASMYGSHQQYQQPQHLSPYQQQHNPYSQDPLQDPGGGPRLPRRARQDQGGEAWTLGYQTSQPQYPFDPARPQDSLAYQPGPPREQDQHFPVKVEMVKQEEPLKPAPGELENVTVKTKFPVARIKRIVQADDDVGKVAQVTPVVVSKALELFMISLALKSADNARARQSKRVLGSHLKSVIETEGQFDFLSDIASRIADAPSGPSKEPGKKGVKSEDEDEDDVADEYEAAPKKKGRGTRSRPKKESP